MIRLIAALLLLALPPKAGAEEIVLGLSQDEIGITATFDGDDILIFGAVRRDGPINDAEPLEVIIAVSGPLTPVTVRRKERVLGIWVNTAVVEVDAAPSFYAIATSAPIGEAISNVEDLRQKLTVRRAIRSVGAPILGAEAFTRALIRIRAAAGLYQTLVGAVAFDEQTLFRTAIQLPANLTEGDYSARVVLTRNGIVVDEHVVRIPVKKVGLERWLFNLSREEPLLYGLMSLAIAIAAGWGASAAFSLIRR